MAVITAARAEESCDEVSAASVRQPLPQYGVLGWMLYSGGAMQSQFAAAAVTALDAAVAKAAAKAGLDLAELRREADWCVSSAFTPAAAERAILAGKRSEADWPDEGDVAVRRGLWAYAKEDPNRMRAVALARQAARARYALAATLVQALMRRWAAVRSTEKRRFADRKRCGRERAAMLRLHRLVSNALRVLLAWREVTATSRRARAFLRRYLSEGHRRVFGAWRSVTAKSLSSKQFLRDLDFGRGRKVLRAWRDLAKRSTKAFALRTKHLVCTARAMFHAWHVYASQNGIALAFYSRLGMPEARKAFAAWRALVYKSRRAEFLFRKHVLQGARKTFEAWIAYSNMLKRGRALIRRTFSAALNHAFFLWRDGAALQRRLQRFVANFLLGASEKVFFAWRSAARDGRLKRLRLAGFLAKYLVGGKRKVFAAWKTYATKSIKVKRLFLRGIASLERNAFIAWTRNWRGERAARGVLQRFFRASLGRKTAASL
ncbi:hypothetical protein M885DRAFT_511364 [Pelagophyceae sp. CCMP2097]|nr:hypothetical protein M885DRAFT_511364 [Pelagophyceae sp. CCMP2097]